MKNNTIQEKLWKDSNWSKQYINRNNSNRIKSSNVALFSKILDSINQPLDSVLEIGPNIGLNLDAINALDDRIIIDCLEINIDACHVLRGKPFIRNVFNDSISNFKSYQDAKYDLVFTKGVLIHLNPNDLSEIYEKIYSMSNRFVLFAEYYNPTPVSISYRGIENVLFKRDFAGEFLDKFSDFRLIDYGFVYHRDNVFPQDDITWFLLELNKWLH